VRPGWVVTACAIGVITVGAFRLMPHPHPHRLNAPPRKVPSDTSVPVRASVTVLPLRPVQPPPYDSVETGDFRPAEPQRPKKIRASKRAPAAPAPASSSQAQLTELQNLAREAYGAGNYVEPQDASAITYSKSVLGLDPRNGYAKTLLENSVQGGKYQVDQAIIRKDFAAAHRLADALAQLMPGRADIAELEEDISTAEKTERHPALAAVPLVSFKVIHMHSNKAPTSGGPFCKGTLSVSGQHLKFIADSASDGHPHNLDFACSDVREIKPNTHVAARQGAFHVRTSSGNYNFVPENGFTGVVPALTAACSK
jgi:hypothetical protein